MLARKGKSFKDIVEVLKVFYDNVGDDDTSSSDDKNGAQPPPPVDVDASPPQKLILGELINFMEGIQ